MNPALAARHSEAPPRHRQLPAPAIHIRPAPPERRPRCIVFDFDGTLSLLRAGWADIMIPQMLDELLPLPGTTETADELEPTIREAILNHNGRPTVYQMMFLADQVRQRGGVPQSAEAYTAEFVRRLTLQSETRCEAIRSGAGRPDDYLVPGARQLLEAFRDRGVPMTLASGTEEIAVRRESALLQIDEFFEGRIHGPSDENPHAFSKLAVMERLKAEHGLRGEELAGIGDGAVEIESLKSLGGLAVGIASDERHRSGALEGWKVPRLLSAGADAVVGDYRDLESLLAWLGW
ncbi:HAD family hydrolase [Planctellipticum variicoloris]|uniref:HAD family hydrolase n=1 Tax=Planctellipticum variicoloris TaxID=3064265 RepID=UPI0030137D0E|nr:HAD family hydrolase [Planctomycetaceae bacterium SH412]